MPQDCAAPLPAANPQVLHTAPHVQIPEYIRANHMGKCYELIEKKFGREYADQLLVNHPAKILTGEMK